MKASPNSITILLADDDDDERLLAEEAFEENNLLNILVTVDDGETVLDYLYRRNGYEAAKRPHLIVLDLHMVRKGGLETLREIKASEELRHIPVIMMTTSQAEEDIFRCYDAGANSYIAKPVSFESLVAVVKAIGFYWFQIVELPAVKGQ